MGLRDWHFLVEELNGRTVIGAPGVRDPDALDWCWVRDHPPVILAEGSKEACEAAQRLIFGREMYLVQQNEAGRWIVKWWERR